MYVFTLHMHTCSACLFQLGQMIQIISVSEKDYVRDEGSGGVTGVNRWVNESLPLRRQSALIYSQPGVQLLC